MTVHGFYLEISVYYGNKCNFVHLVGIWEVKQVRNVFRFVGIRALNTGLYNYHCNLKKDLTLNKIL